MPRRLPLLLGALVAVLGLGYAATFVLYGDRVPRGVHVLDVDLSGKSPAAARSLLSRELAAVAGRSFTVVAVGRRLAVVPASVGMRMDVAATVADARSAGVGARLRGLFGVRRDVEPVIVLGNVKGLLASLARKVESPPREGSVTFRGVSPVAVAPVPGSSLDLDAALDAVRSGYLHRTSITMPVVRKEPRTTRAQVDAAMKTAAAAVDAPIEVDVEGRTLVVEPLDIARGLSFDLAPHLDASKVAGSLGRRLEAAEQLPVDATFDVRSGTPVLVPSKIGRTVNDDDLAAALTKVLTDPAPRRTSVGLHETAPRVTTGRARGLGIREVIGTFTTYHPCCAPRVTNIHTIADIVDGYVVLPGETFSLNGVVGRRDTARGFVLAPQILRGQFVKDVGGGVSQFATTLFNAVFFSGLRDVQHTPHSYYISRYPPGRESTVSYPQPDFRFQDDAPSGVLITAAYTDTSITVTFWGTKRFDITSESGPRTRVTPFGTEYVDRPDCTPSTGAEGFDIVVTRIFRVGGRVVKREPFRTHYLPEPHFICGKPPPGQPAKQPPPSPAPAPSPSPSPSA